MKTWIINGSNGSKKTTLMMTEADNDFYSIGIRRGRRITECLALVNLASYLIDRGWEFDPAIVTESMDEAARFCPGAVVGISTQINNYGNSLCLARIAKESGAKLVVMGGPHASNRAEQIINNQANVDMVVRGQGEAAFHRIILGQTLRGVVEEEHLALNLLPSRRRELWHNLWGVEEVRLFGRRWALANWGEGCPQAICGKPCLFCSVLQAKKFSRRTNEQIIQELQNLRDCGIGALEVGDDDFAGVFSQAQLVELSRDLKAFGLDFSLLVHSRAASIKSREHLLKLHEAGVRILQVGFESGDPAIKAVVSDKATLELEDQLVDWCAECGIKFLATFVVGMPGENEVSMRKTINRARQLSDRGVLWSLMMDPLDPLPGSRAFEMLCREHPEFSADDRIDPEKYLAAWFNKFTSIKLADFLELRQELFSQIKIEAVGGMLLR